MWLADDTQLGRKVAIKFVTEALGDDATARERLHREARSAAALERYRTIGMPKHVEIAERMLADG